MRFFDQPILNSPYLEPDRHWELDEAGRPTDTILESRRRAELVSAIPAPRRNRRAQQSEMVLDAGHGLSTDAQEFNPTPIINELRGEIERWRALPNPEQWQVTPATAQLLRHWRALQADDTQAIRPFFCQLEAVEAAIWLAEVAPKSGKRSKRFLDYLKAANDSANPELCLGRKTGLAMAFRLMMSAQAKWRKLDGANRLPEIDEGVKFKDGIMQRQDGIMQRQAAA